LKDFASIDSKYRFVIIASKRAKEILKGAKPRIKTKSKNAVRIAQSEVKLGLVDFEIIPTVKEEIPEPEERVFLGAHAGAVFEEEHEPEAEVAGKVAPAAAEEGEELGVDFTDEFEGPEEGEEEEKEGGEEESGTEEEES
jgi:DNA-directed RNA polymerase subunit K/omega